MPAVAQIDNLVGSSRRDDGGRTASHLCSILGDGQKDIYLISAAAAARNGDDKLARGGDDAHLVALVHGGRQEDEHWHTERPRQKDLLAIPNDEDDGDSFFAQLPCLGARLFLRR